MKQGGRGVSGGRSAARQTARPDTRKPRSEPRKAGETRAASRPSPKAQVKAATQETLATGVQTLVVAPDEAGMRVDRFLVARFPQLAFTHIQRIVRKGELRIDGKRAKPNERLEPGAKVRIPPLKLDQPKPAARAAAADEDARAFLKSIILYEDRDVLVLNKPMGLAVQGGSGTKRHVDGLLKALRDEEGQKPRLDH